MQFQHHLHSKWTKHKAMKLVLDSMEQSTNQFCNVIDAFCSTKHKYQLMTNAQEPWGCFPWISLLSYFSQLARAAPTRTVITTILILRQCTFLVPSDQNTQSDTEMGKSFWAIKTKRKAGWCLKYNSIEYMNCQLFVDNYSSSLPEIEEILHADI